jgi:2-oxoacid:acceptor oxidoreductase delta subunit (pyruvate/2-ketoisovalerate family)
MRPVVVASRCVKCATCWAFCPTQCIVEHARWFEPALERCKGCGLCAHECPHHAILMVDEEG